MDLQIVSEIFINGVDILFAGRLVVKIHHSNYEPLRFGGAGRFCESTSRFCLLPNTFIRQEGIGVNKGFSGLDTLVVQDGGLKKRCFQLYLVFRRKRCNRYWILRLIIFSKDMRKRSKRKEKKKLTDTGLLEIPWILDVKGFSDG
jgi:hypothetical protein